MSGSRADFHKAGRELESSVGARTKLDADGRMCIWAGIAWRLAMQWAFRPEVTPEQRTAFLRHGNEALKLAEKHCDEPGGQAAARVVKQLNAEAASGTTRHREDSEAYQAQLRAAQRSALACGGLGVVPCIDPGPGAAVPLAAAAAVLIGPEVAIWLAAHPELLQPLATP